MAPPRSATQSSINSNVNYGQQAIGGKIDNKGPVTFNYGDNARSQPPVSDLQSADLDSDYSRHRPPRRVTVDRNTNVGQQAVSEDIGNNDSLTWNYGVDSDSSLREGNKRRQPTQGVLEKSSNPPRKLPTSNPRPGRPRRTETPPGSYPTAETHSSTSAVRSTPFRTVSSPTQAEFPPIPDVNGSAPTRGPGPDLQPPKTSLPIPNPLYDDADVELFSIHRSGKTQALYKVIQTEVKYAMEDQVDYSILAFRLKRGEDIKRCLEVKLTGTFTQNNRYNKRVDVKKLHHVPSKENKLVEAVVDKTSTGQTQIQVGFNGKPIVLLTITGIQSTQFKITKGQKIVSSFNDSQDEGKFSLTLGLDDGLEKDSDLSVSESVWFYVMLKLEEERQPMLLNLKTDVKYASKKWSSFGSRSKVVSQSHTHEYSGRPSLDIKKSGPEISNTPTSIR